MSFTRRSHKIINITAHPAHRTYIFVLSLSSVLSSCLQTQIFSFGIYLRRKAIAERRMRRCHFKQTDDDAVFLTYISPKNKDNQAMRLLFAFLSLFALQSQKRLISGKFNPDRQFLKEKFSAARVITSQLDRIKSTSSLQSANFGKQSRNERKHFISEQFSKTFIRMCGRLHKLVNRESKTKAKLAIRE